MIIPDEIQIGPLTYKVFTKTPLVDGIQVLRGQTDHVKEEIWLDSALLEDQMAVTFFHELVHVVDTIGGTHFGEDQTEVLANLLMEATRRNNLDWRKPEVHEEETND